uniref:Uncharacterized protein n=1 Tax=Leptobrachium leishanense TaxID=445787 RepID=A0A8C5PAK1_9ANUR
MPRPTTPMMRTNSASSVFSGLTNRLMVSTKMLNISAVAKIALPKAPTTSALDKPYVFLGMEIRWERTAKPSDEREREFPIISRLVLPVCRHLLSKKSYSTWGSCQISRGFVF